INPFYLRNIVKAAILTGLRKGDMLNLKWSDYKRETQSLYFYEKKKKKMSNKVLNSDMIGLLESIPQGEANTSLRVPMEKP
ncbi:MAG: hypothetical protein Q8O18_10040, partial [Deltaproteobacteria bacterium]|nr:hypothetical protein [Deltaproteobacteria bacterium]